MKDIILVAGTNFPAASDTAKWFRKQGATVYELPTVNDKAALKSIMKSLESEEKLDYLIIQAQERTENPSVLGNLNYPQLMQTIENNMVSTFEMIEPLLPFLEKGKKRIELITSASTSVQNVTETEDYGYAMSQAGLHMIFKILFNRLHPEGYTFRAFCPNPDGSGILAGEYAYMDLCYDPREDFGHSSENFFVMRDGNFNEIPW